MSQLRRSRQEVLCEKSAPQNLTKFTGKHLCQVLLLIKRFFFLIKGHPRHKCFTMTIMKFLKTPILQNTSGSCF